MVAPLVRYDPLPRTEEVPPFVALLRLAALDCRAAARLDAVRACAVLSPDADAGEIAHLLARVLIQATIRRPVIFAPGTAHTSHDEDWLIALAQSFARGDRASRRFLLTRHCTPQTRDAVGLLVDALRKLLDRG